MSANLTALYDASHHLLAAVTYRGIAEGVEHSLPLGFRYFVNKEDWTEDEQQAKRYNRGMGGEAHKRLADAELAGRAVIGLTQVGFFGSGFLKEGGELAERWQAGLASVNKYSKLSSVAGGSVAAAMSFARGKNYEERVQGLSLLLSDTTAEVVGSMMGLVASKAVTDKKIATYIEMGTRSIAGVGLSLGLVPLFSYGLAKIGRAIDQGIENVAYGGGKHRDERREAEASMSLPYTGGSDAQITTNTKKSSSKRARTKIHTEISDQRLSRRDIDEALARRIEHSWAF